jgi:hypothetical protein
MIQAHSVISYGRAALVADVAFSNTTVVYRGTIQSENTIGGTVERGGGGGREPGQPIAERNPLEH